MVWPRKMFTRFEVARLIGARALQISLGAPILVDAKDILEPIEIAKLEFKNKIIPITIKRKLPSGEEIVIDAKAAIENWLEDHRGEI